MTTTPAAAPDRALPAPDDWHTTAELSVRVGRAPYTIREHLRGEVAPPLHGHCIAGRWQVKGTVGDAWIQGLDPAAQRRVCGCPDIGVGGRRRRAP